MLKLNNEYCKEYSHNFCQNYLDLHVASSDINTLAQADQFQDLSSKEDHSCPHLRCFKSSSQSSEE